MKAILSYLALTPFCHVSKGTISGRYSKCYIACYGSAKEDGEISEGFHVLEHSCWEGQCSLSSVSINQCMDSGSGKKAFYPRVQYSATLRGYLQVRNEGNSLIVHESGSDSSTGMMIDPWGNQRVAIQLTGNLNRRDFHIDYSEPLDIGPGIGDEVTIRIFADGIIKKKGK